MPSLEFVNHASVLLSHGRTGLLTDPWYFGDAFHRGWSLLVENDDTYIRSLLARTTHIWYSHEHPDHFSIPFLKRYGETIRAKGIHFLFQKTRDGRVCNYLRQHGFTVQEMADTDVLTLGEDFTVQTVRSDLYDSALLADVGGVRVFNLNDCPLTSARDLHAFASRYGTCDVLLTQFSYAAWKGGRENIAWRQRAAKSKLAAMRRQVMAFKPAVCIPFASFVRFSHELNVYMNDAVNQPATVAKKFSRVPVRLVFMQPGEVQALDNVQPDPASVRFWQNKFESVPQMPLNRYEDGLTRADLEAACRAWQQRIFRKNSRLLMRLGRLLPFKPFQATVVRVADLGIQLRIDLFAGISDAAPDEAADVSMHSASLKFAFDNDFGLDTLVVNGCFEEWRAGGFDSFAKCFAIGNMNAMGLHIGPAILKRLDVVMSLLRKLVTMRRNLGKAA